jgi:thiamine kinase-like enzyme
LKLCKQFRVNFLQAMSPTTDEFTWITLEFLNKILYRAHKDRLEVIGFHLEPATKKGDNYASDMLKCQMTLCDSVSSEVTQESVILKIIPSGEIQLKVLVKSKIFPREIHAYTNVISEVETLLRTLGDQTEISPKCFYTQLEPKAMLVFEDLKARNYQMVDRRQLLDLEHAMLVMEKLGKLHAASTVVHEKTASSMLPFLEGSICDNPDRQDFLEFFHMAARALREQVLKWGDKWRNIADKLDNDFGTSMILRGRALYLRDDQKFNVFNHNDVWINNLLYKYETSGRVSDVLMVDYQLSYWGSPGIDINYFLYGSVRDEVREKHFDELVGVYYGTLASTLKLLHPNKSVISKKEVLKEIAKKQYLGNMLTPAFVSQNFKVFFFF